LIAQKADAGARRIRAQAKGFKCFEGVGTKADGRGLRKEARENPVLALLPSHAWASGPPIGMKIDKF
jgi:hypothetical protein